MKKLKMSQALTLFALISAISAQDVQAQEKKQSAFRNRGSKQSSSPRPAEKSRPVPVNPAPSHREKFDAPKIDTRPVVPKVQPRPLNELGRGNSAPRTREIGGRERSEPSRFGQKQESGHREAFTPSEKQKEIPQAPSNQKPAFNSGYEKTTPIKQGKGVDIQPVVPLAPATELQPFAKKKSPPVLGGVSNLGAPSFVKPAPKLAPVQHKPVFGGSSSTVVLNPGKNSTKQVSAFGTSKVTAAHAPVFGGKVSSNGKLFVGGSAKKSQSHYRNRFSFSFGFGLPYLSFCHSPYAPGYSFNWCWTPYRYRSYYNHCWDWFSPIYYVPYYYRPVYYCDYYDPYFQSQAQVVNNVYYINNDGDSYTSVNGGSVSVSSEWREEELKQMSPAEQFSRLGDLFFRRGQYDQAAIAYERALREDPNRASLHFVLADARFAMGDYLGAALAIRHGLVKEPALVSAQIDKRDFYEKSNEFEKQMNALSQYMNVHPDNADAMLVLGYNLHFSGQREEAKKVFAQVLTINPIDEAAELFLKN